MHGHGLTCVGGAHGLVSQNPQTGAHTRCTSHTHHTTHHKHTHPSTSTHIHMDTDHCTQCAHHYDVRVSCYVFVFVSGACLHTRTTTMTTSTPQQAVSAAETFTYQLHYYSHALPTLTHHTTQHTYLYSLTWHVKTWWLVFNPVRVFRRSHTCT